MEPTAHAKEKHSRRVRRQDFVPNERLAGHVRIAIYGVASGSIFTAVRARSKCSKTLQVQTLMFGVKFMSDTRRYVQSHIDAAPTFNVWSRRQHGQLHVVYKYFSGTAASQPLQLQLSGQQPVSKQSVVTLGANTLLE